MGDQKNPNPSQNPRNPATGNPADKQNPQRDRESATQPGKQMPDEKQQPNERASNPDRSRDLEDDAARRQSRQDPLQKRDS